MASLLVNKRAVILGGIILIIISQIIFGLVFYPIAKKQIIYLISQRHSSLEPKIVAQNGEFKILIPKIEVNSQVFANTDPFDKAAYLEILKKGVAHAKGSSLPGQEGNVFIFAHSSDSPLNIANYNAVFYLVDELEKGDAIYLTYKGKYYKYLVEEKKLIDSKEISYLTSSKNGDFLTLMTCWPPGTTFKRLLISSRLTE